MWATRRERPFRPTIPATGSTARSSGSSSTWATTATTTWWIPSTPWPWPCHSSSHESLSALLAVGAVSLAVTACGESEQEKAQSEVCDGRADIQQQIGDLKNLTLSTASVGKVQDGLNSIGDDLQNIKDAQGDLDGDRKQQVQ